MLHYERTLVLCNLRSILRKKTNKNLFLLSSFFLFIILFIMWFVSSGKNLNFLSNEVYIYIIISYSYFLFLISFILFIVLGSFKIIN